MFRVLIKEPAPEWRQVILEALSDRHEIIDWPEKKSAAAVLDSRHFDLIILDLQPDEPEPFKILGWIHDHTPYTPVIMISRTEKAELAVKAIRLGAFDFIAKPFTAERIRLVSAQALENRSLKNEIDYLRRNQDVIYQFDQIIAVSPSMRELIQSLKKFAQTDATVFVTGETGTGKSFLSGTIHFNSQRRHKPFIKINCANIPETLLESELFGHEKGSFTGADKLRIGRFEQAHGGTLFLDEIGETSMNLQAKLLRVLEDKSFERVGGNKTIYSDVRLIAATNRDLHQLIAQGRFREDLYYRINVLSVVIPPLRQRRQCIEPLARLLLDKMCRSLKKTIVDFSPEVLAWMRSYDWPGNIRQLANTIERAVILETEDFICKENVIMIEPGPPAPAENPARPIESMEILEKQMIVKALEEKLWIQKDAAAALGISPRALNYKIKKYRLTHPRWRKNR